MMAAASVRRDGFPRAVADMWRTIRTRPRACVAMALPYAAFIGVATGLSKAVTLDVGPSAVAVSEVAVTGIAIFIAIAVFVAINAVMLPLTLGGLSMVSSASVYGDAMEVRSMRRQIFDRGTDAIGAFVLAALILAAAPVALGVLASFVSVVSSSLVGFAILVFALAVIAIPEIYVGVRLSLVVPVAIRQGARPRDALKRSWDLVHGARWVWVFGVELLAAIVAVVAVVVLAAIGDAVHASGFAKFVIDVVFGGLEALTATAVIGVALGIVYANVASAEPEVGAHEVLPQELPPL
jgi:hypothetical protein